MIKHVGKHNNRKVVILFKTVPNEEHMALVAYSDSLPRIIHDAVMETLESPVGQQANEFSDALFRQTLADGRNCLSAMHQESLIKKIPTNQVVVTPTTNSSVRLDELNEILAKMKGGEDAVKRLSELDNNQGIKGTQKTTQRDVGEPANVQSADVLTDEMLAAERLGQAQTMKAEAQRLIAEAARLEQEADELAPKKTKTTRTTNASKKTKTQTV